MKLTFVGHACALVEHQGKRLLFDPWLSGPVYWGAWWHFPRAQFTPDIFNVDYIYITHWHFDHMHAESLERFSREAHLFLPKFPVSGLPDSLRQMGFKRITELSTGASFDLAPGFRLHSFQVQMQDDSLAVVECTDASTRPFTIVNLNDAKPLPSTWRRLQKRFPRVDMMWRSHSPAWSYPTAFSFENADDAIPVSRETYKGAFRQAAEKLNPRYAVAFASGVCHLTDDTLFENDNLVLGDEMQNHFAAHPLPGVELVCPRPGTTFTQEEGFTPSHPPGDRHALRAFVENEREAQRERLAEEERRIDARTLPLDVFSNYFCAVRARSRPLWFLLQAVWRFDLLSSRGTRTLWFDFNRNLAWEGESALSPTARFTVREGILAEALETMTFSNIDVAKRWKVWLAGGHVTKYFMINTFMGLNEAGYLRLANLFNIRLWWGLIRRRDELCDYARMAIRFFLKGKTAVLTETIRSSRTTSNS